MIFQTSMIMLHVNLQGCTTTRNCWNVFLRDYEVAVLMSSLRALSGSDRAACRASLVAQRNQSSPGEKKNPRKMFNKCPLKRNHFKRKWIMFQPLIFRWFVCSFQWGICFFCWNGKSDGTNSNHYDHTFLFKRVKMARTKNLTNSLSELPSSRREIDMMLNWW